MLKRATKNRPRLTATAGEIMETFYIIKTDEEISIQDIKLSQEQWDGCVKLLYAMNRAGFDLSKLKIITNYAPKPLDKIK